MLVGGFVRGIAVLLAGMLAVFPGQRCVEAAPTTRSVNEYTVPDVKLVRDDGVAVALPAEIDDGRSVILNFIFTTCAAICPVMSQTFAQLQTKLGGQSETVHMMSISLDPEQDTPERLSEYAKKFHAGSQWRFYTGTSEASVATQRAFAVFRGDKMNHIPVTFMRGAPGKPWLRFEGFATSDDLLHAFRELNSPSEPHL
jgi:protein SCO1/2